mgnify:CR=1 FL=1
MRSRSRFSRRGGGLALLLLLVPASVMAVVDFAWVDGTLLGSTNTDETGLARLTEYVLAPAGVHQVTATARVGCYTGGDATITAAVTTWPLGNEAYTVKIYQAPPDTPNYQVSPIQQEIAAAQ